MVPFVRRAVLRAAVLGVTLGFAAFSALDLAALSAHGAELPAIFETTAGRYILAELGLGESQAISAELRLRLAADLERVRTRLAAQGEDGELFSRTSPVLGAGEAAALRSAFIEQAREVREFVELGAHPQDFAARREAFLQAAPNGPANVPAGAPALPKGHDIVFIAQRADLLAGRIYEIELPRDNQRLGQYVDRFEQGAIAEFLRRYPKALEAWGVRVIEKLPSSLVLEVPDIDALNARLRLQGHGLQFSVTPTEDALPIKPYLELAAQHRIAVAPIGQTARHFTHDLLVHAIAIAAFVPAAVTDAFAEEAAALLKVYAQPKVQASPALKDYVKSVMRSEVILFDRQSAEVMLHAAESPEVRDQRLGKLFGEMRGGAARAHELLRAPSEALSAADRARLDELLR